MTYKPNALQKLIIMSFWETGNSKEDNKSEIHLFVIWEHARVKEFEIIKDLGLKFNVLKIFEVFWSLDKFNENLSRFYGANFPPNYNKEKHCGTGPVAVIVEAKRLSIKITSLQKEIG